MTDRLGPAAASRTSAAGGGWVGRGQTAVASLRARGVGASGRRFGVDLSRGECLSNIPRVNQPAERIPYSRRSILRGGMLVGAGTMTGAVIGTGTSGATGASDEWPADTAESFFGAHQPGISTGTQRQTILAAFDLTANTSRRDVTEVLREWTALAATLAAGASTRIPVFESSSRPSGRAGVTENLTREDSFEADRLGPQQLTLTIGFGRSLFRAADGCDRFGLSTRLPPALIELPSFEGDALVSAESDGDLLVHACANDPQVAFHAVRSIDRVAPEIASLRWTQSGFAPSSTGGTPRNLLGFKDGTVNSNLHPPASPDAILWAGPEGPAWMHGGTYVVYRRIRIHLEQWDVLAPTEQEQVIGRRKVDGAPLGQPGEFSPLGLGRLDSGGNWWIPPTSHVRVASPEVNDGAVIVRRSFSYANGTTTGPGGARPTQNLEYDAGSLFLGYQKDPRTAFVPIYDKLALIDELRRFTTHTASAVFALPPGASGPDDWVGRLLFT